MLAIHLMVDHGYQIDLDGEELGVNDIAEALANKFSKIIDTEPDILKKALLGE